MYDPEAIYQDADIEKWEMEQVGNAIHKLEAAGICTHQSAVGVSASGEIFYPEQVGLKRGQLRCHGCKEVFDSDEDWDYARHYAIEGWPPEQD